MYFQEFPDPVLPSPGWEVVPGSKEAPHSARSSASGLTQDHLSSLQAMGSRSGSMLRPVSSENAGVEMSQDEEYYQAMYRAARDEIWGQGAIPCLASLLLLLSLSL